MPGFDGTGPRGLGPMTGGGRGYCAVPLGAGIGYRRWSASPPRGMQYDPAYGEDISQSEIDQLKNEFDALLKQLEDINERISRLEKK